MNESWISDPHGRSRGPSLPLRSALRAVVLLIVAAGFLLLAPRGLAEGPLKEPSNVFTQSVGVAVNPGQPATFGLLELTNPTTMVITVDRLELERATPGLRLVGAYLSPIDSGRHITAGPGFAASAGDQMVGAELNGMGNVVLKGVELRPHEPVFIVLGFAPPRAGEYLFHPVVVRYSVDGKNYGARYRDSFRVCAPLSSYPGSGKGCGLVDL
jgi:hypothetical protein